VARIEATRAAPARGTLATVQIFHLGQSCVLVETGDARLLLDPGIYSTGFDELTDLDAILVTHQHPDHLDQERLPDLLAANSRAALLTDPDTANLLSDKGIEATAVSAGSEHKVGAATVTGANVDHDAVASGAQLGERHRSFRIERQGNGAHS